MPAGVSESDGGFTLVVVRNFLKFIRPFPHLFLNFLLVLVSYIISLQHLPIISSNGGLLVERFEETFRIKERYLRKHSVNEVSCMGAKEFLLILRMEWKEGSVESGVVGLDERLQRIHLL